MSSPDKPSSTAYAALAALTILLSAFLLFQVQPLIGKYILPWFGGSPAVWTTSLLFFQTVLFAGYAYAFFIDRSLTPWRRTIVHLVVLVGALAALPIGPSDVWKPGSSDHPAGRILLLLAICVGLPYFALSSTGPLVQAFFRRAYPDRSPYRLYALSNVGSLLALVSYPFLVEPLLDVNHQALAWSCGFALFCILCGLATWQARHFSEPIADDGVEAIVPPPTWSRRLAWLLLPALASMMLLATTNHVCQEVAVVPMLWVIPLGLYLISFIICFDHERWYWPVPFALLALVALYASVGIERPASWTALRWLSDVSSYMRGKEIKPWNPKVHFTQELAVHFTSLFAVAMICHGELVRLRPQPRYLTSFYLMISAGGALGGAFVTLVAPRVFNRYLEWPIGIGLGLALAIWVVVRATRRAVNESSRLRWRGILQLVGLIAAVAVGFDVCRFWSAPTPGGAQVLERVRNFYGTLRVAEHGKPGELSEKRQLYSGRTLHGVQYQHPDRRRTATSYYGDKSGVGQAIRESGKAGPIRIAVVGLGAGTLATFARSEDTYQFLEINDAVVRIADQYFTYLSDARDRGVKVDLVLGDARLMLEKQLREGAKQSFDVIVLDAFSGDAIPNHLLTVEAFDIYLPLLKESGVLVVHTSNRYLNLTRVVYALADHFDLASVEIETSQDEKNSVARSEWIVLGRKPALIDALKAANPEWEKPPAENRWILWTDRRHNLFEILE